MKPLRKSLSVLLEEAKARVAAMSPEEREAMWQAQRESWVRGEMAMGESSVVMKPTQPAAHPLTDEQIAEFWPDADPVDIRRQFDNLIAHHLATPTIDLHAAFWHQIMEAAKQSNWMPAEYTMNDWVSDVCAFLREGGAA
ncbi:hypothetical protein [Mesorhizobium sp. B2-8-9]|uniref:hypothetical protein n=1 Tax=Mesorhizobium sp. B2-8-9 TaxID=2589899 RepID=UPI00112A28CB|nr:hypothetical protein [Mesorhizobium sp. B2-8-9]TPI86392.1 hypothetical protein FJ423_00790 [Mesorhizobium sp. B2-8-9]